MGFLLRHPKSFSKTQSQDREVVLQKDLAPFTYEGARLSECRWGVAMDFENEEDAAEEPSRLFSQI